jgi:signal transduction histidine kinase/DNA-binding response OmpR family regulator
MMDNKANILIVDDLPEKLLVLESILQELEQNVVRAQSGREALRRLLERDYAVILLDVNMPDMDGFETAALIRQRPRSQHTPILFITAYTDEVHAAQGYSLGAVDYITSPLIPEVLRTKVGVFVDLYQKTEQVKRQAEQRITLAHEQAARAAAEEVTRRSLFLAEASTVLLRSLDPEPTLRSLARQVVPFLGDLGAGILVDSSGGGVCKIEVAWTDPAGGVCRQQTLEKDVLPPYLAGPVRRALELGKMERVTNPTQAPSASAGTPRAGASGLCGAGAGLGECELAIHNAVILPLQARGRTLGVLLLAMGPSGRCHSPADLALAEDLAGRAALALDNARLYRDIQTSDRQKNEFLAMLAHELRNPLAPLRNAALFMQLPDLEEPKQKWALGVIERQVQQLTRMVDDLLDVSRITRGKINLQKEEIDLATVIHRAVEISRPLIDERKHHLSVSLPPEPLRIVADPARLAQVVSNLLNNAAKYTEEGGTIWLSAGQAGGELVIRVRDTGVGIEPEMLSNVFDLFTQADHSLDRSQGGLGIGLTLVRRLVEMHGGSVQVFSAGLKQGSEFVVRLPILVEATAPTNNGTTSHAPAPPSSRVLIIDDNVDGAESLALLLRMMGQKVHTAYDGVAGLEAVDTFEPEIILLDIGLPRMNGYEVAREVRRRGSGAILVAVTGYGQEEDRSRSRDAGFDHHLVKPVELGHLLELFASLQIPLEGNGSKPSSLAHSPASATLATGPAAAP